MTSTPAKEIPMLATLTPAEVDALWLEAAQPRNALLRRRNELLATAAKDAS